MPQDNRILAALLSGTNPSRGDRGRSARTGLGLPMPLQQPNPQGPAALAQLLLTQGSDLSPQQRVDAQKGLLAMASTSNLGAVRRGFSSLSETRQRWLKDSDLVDLRDPRAGRTVSVGPGGRMKEIDVPNLASREGVGNRVFHETDLQSARQMLPRLERKLARQDFFASPSQDLALGQSGRGVIFEFDSSMVNGTIPNSFQNQTARAMGSIAEVKINKTVPGSLQAIIVSNRRQLESLRKISGLDRKFDFDAAADVGRGIRIPRIVND